MEWFLIQCHMERWEVRPRWEISHKGGCPCRQCIALASSCFVIPFSASQPPIGVNCPAPVLPLFHTVLRPLKPWTWIHLSLQQLFLGIPSHQPKAEHSLPSPLLIWFHRIATCYGLHNYHLKELALWTREMNVKPLSSLRPNHPTHLKVQPGKTDSRWGARASCQAVSWTKIRLLRQDAGKVRQENQACGIKDLSYVGVSCTQRERSWRTRPDGLHTWTNTTLNNRLDCIPLGENKMRLSL